MKRLVYTLAAVSGMTMAGAAVAATATVDFDVTAIVESSCTVTATDLDFGIYVPSATDYDAGTNTISVSCTTDTSFDVGISEGAAPAATVLTRRMQSATESSELEYALFTDLGRTDNWGNSAGTDTVADVGTGVSTPVVLSVYGRIPGSAANQNAVPATDYIDTVTVTVTY